MKNHLKLRSPHVYDVLAVGINSRMLERGNAPNDPFRRLASASVQMKNYECGPVRRARLLIGREASKRTEVKRNFSTTSFCTKFWPANVPATRIAEKLKKLLLTVPGVVSFLMEPIHSTNKRILCPLLAW